MTMKFMGFCFRARHDETTGLEEIENRFDGNDIFLGRGNERAERHITACVEGDHII